jgi:hypothetical protein
MKTMKTINATTALANVDVLGTANDSHVTRQSPLDIKRREIADRELTNADENQARVKSTASKRKSNSVRPI